MTYNLTITNASPDFLKAIKNMAKAAKAKVKLNNSKKKPSKMVLDAIKEVERGEVEVCANFAEFKQKVLS
ncbi:MAG: hypothetical protein PUB96_01605 [Helicobacteraceae bacterium]|nr:hypothetical protein [Helicobacteraceae bacterium]